MLRRFVVLALLATACVAIVGCGRDSTPSPSSSPAPASLQSTAPGLTPDDDGGPPRPNDPRPGRAPGFLQESALQPTPTMSPDATNVSDATRRGQVQVLTDLLNKDPGAAKSTDPQGRTPLHLALRRAPLETLLAHGAVVDARDKKGNTPLFYIVAKGNIRTVRRLLEAGPDVNAANQGGMTPLHEAARQGHREIVALLIEKGAKVDAASKDGVTPLMLAVANRADACLEVLLAKSANLEAKDVNGNTALHLSANDGTETIMDALLAKGADVSAQNLAGNTPLHICVLMDHAETAKQLLAKGASLTIKNKAGQTPLELAESRKDAYMVSILKGVSPDKK